MEGALRTTFSVNSILAALSLVLLTCIKEKWSPVISCTFRPPVARLDRKRFIPFSFHTKRGTCAGDYITCTADEVLVK